MSLIRDEDRCCRIIGIFTFVSFLSFCYHRLILVLHACSSVLCAFCESCCSASPLRGRGPVCSEYLCVHTLLYEPISHRSLRFKQSCKSAVSCEEETTCSRRTTKPKRRRWTTKSGGYNTALHRLAGAQHCWHVASQKLQMFHLKQIPNWKGLTIGFVNTSISIA